VPTSCTADTIQPKQIRWLWTHRFAEKINLLVGNPDNGKGLVSIYTVARLTTGEPWFDAENKLPPSEALILAAEDDWDDIIVPRLMAAGADLKNVHKLVMSAQINGSKVEKELSLDRDRSVLDNYLQKHPAIRLVVIDPVSNYLGRTKMIDEQSVRELLAPFKEMASRLHVAFLCIMHLNKKVELDAIHRIGGAMAFTGIARMVWLCAPKPNEDDLHALIHFGCSVRLWLVHEVSSQTQHADRSHRLFMHIPCRHTGTVVNDLCFKSGQ
jgi:putative DNA primase/helicase